MLHDQLPLQSTGTEPDLGRRAYTDHLMQVLGNPKFLRLLMRNKLAVLGLILTASVCLVAIMPQAFAPYDPYEMHTQQRLSPPVRQYPLGTDQFGRDLLSRILHGARISLYVAAISMIVATTAGVSIGLVSGYYGGWADRLLGMAMDTLFAFPAVLLALAITGLLGSSTRNVSIAIGIVNIPVFARVTRAAVLATRDQPYVDAARALGAGDGRIIWQHIVPNILGPVLVQLTVGIAFAILVEAALSFLGVGTQPPAPSWGIMLNEGRSVMQIAPWMAIYPGLAISLTILAFSLASDALRELVDPTLQL